MQKLQIQAHELVMSRDQKSAFADSFIFEPENIEEQALGNLYVIGEVTNFSENSSYLINLLISIVKREYYLNSKRSPLDSLEVALHKANSTLADFAEQGNIEWINNLNITIAVMKDQELHFSQTGHCCVLLVRNGEIANISHGLTSEQTNNHLKTFANIASGQVEAEDQLILATNSFLNIIPENEIKRVSTLEFGKKIKELEKLVRNSRETIESASIIILKANSSDEVIKKLNRIEISENTSAPSGLAIEKTPSIAMENFTDNLQNNSANEKTENPDVLNNIYELEGEGKIAVFKKTAIGVLKGAAAAILKYSMIAISRIIKIIKTKIIPGLKNAGAVISKFISDLPYKIKKSNKKEEVPETVQSFSVEGDEKSVLEETAAREDNTYMPDATEEKPKENIIIEPVVKFPPIFKKEYAPIRLNRAFKLISIKNTIALGVVVLAIYTTSVIMVVKDQKNEEQNAVLYSGLLKEAIQKKEAAELAFIIKEESKAKSLLKESEVSLNKVYSAGYFKEEAAKELAFIDNVVEKLDKIIVLTEPEAAFNITATDNNAEANKLVISENIIYLFGGSKNAIYAYDAAKGTLNKVNASYSNIGNLKAGIVSSDKKIIFYNDTPGIAIYDVKKNEIKQADIALPKNSSSIKDIAAFDAYFYILEPSSEQVIKYKRTTGGFAESKDWITQKGDNNLTKAISVAVDGALYILDDNGKIYKYYGGTPKEFSQYPLFDAIGAGGKITTKSNFRNLYVLDSANKRIVIFDKEGSLIKQIKSEKFDALKDVIILDGEKNAYVLNGTVVYKIGL